MLSIDNYEQDVLAVGYQKKTIKTNTNGIILIICPSNICWGVIIVCPYQIWLKVVFVLKKQNNVSMSFRLDILLTQH